MKCVNPKLRLNPKVKVCSYGRAGSHHCCKISCAVSHLNAVSPVKQFLPCNMAGHHSTCAGRSRPGPCSWPCSASWGPPAPCRSSSTRSTPRDSTTRSAFPGGPAQGILISIVWPQNASENVIFDIHIDHFILVRSIRGGLK